jgi:hypothetical protein
LAWLLLGHAPPRRPDETAEGIEDGPLGMAGAMRLRPAGERVPHVGDRLITRREIAALGYGHDEHVMRPPHPGNEWCVHAARGLPVRIALGLDPRADAVDAYIRQAAARGTVLLGATGVRSRFGRRYATRSSARGRRDMTHAAPGHPVTAAVLLTNAQPVRRVHT